MTSKKEALIKKIEQVESQLRNESSESYAWNKGKFKNSSQAKLSKTLVESRKNELEKLYAELAALEKQE